MRSGLPAGSAHCASGSAPSASVPASQEAVTTSPRRSPLDRWHRAHGAKMVEFGGWEMPLRFSGGTLAEHLACRRAAAVFDVSHLGTVRFEGPGAFAVLQAGLTNDLRKISPGRAQYTHLLDDDGSVLDDMIVWWVAEERFDVMPNASNTSRARAVLGGEDVTAGRAVLAVQGPAARSVLAAAFPEACEVGRFQVRRLTWRPPTWRRGTTGGQPIDRPETSRLAVPTVVAGTGYTGEDGVEVAVPAEAAEGLWEALLAAGAVPAGLGARDTLRLEAGLPLHGHELGPGTTPLEAGLSWVVAWEKPGGFRGLPALLEKRSAGVRRRLMGVLGDGRQPFREGYSVCLETLVAPEPSSPPSEPGPVLAGLASPRGGAMACADCLSVPLGPVCTSGTAGASGFAPAPSVPAGASATPGEPSEAVLTSGNYSPVLERGIGMCFLPSQVQPGTRASVRGGLPATVVKLPFVRGAKAPAR